MENKEKDLNNKKQETKQPKKNEQASENKNDKVVELQIEITNLKKELELKNNTIKNLEAQIVDLNNTLVTKVTEKANEAQTRLDEKIKEYQIKFEKDLQEIKKYALKDKAVDLIDIINNFEMAVNNSPNNPEIQNYLVGFKMFSNMFQNYLSDNAIKEIVVKINDEFDPLTMDPFEAVELENTKPNLVTKVIKKGYKLHDRVIKPVVVQVSK